jgi:hypothetical protein
MTRLFLLGLGAGRRSTGGGERAAAGAAAALSMAGRRSDRGGGLGEHTGDDPGDDVDRGVAISLTRSR